MGKTEWTDEQLAAIELQGNLLVAAAAGSGKTAVLVERILRHVMDEAHPLELDRLLVVTFTKAAAAEMRERVGKALEEALWQESDKERAERLLRQLHLLPQANITTLHSFCLELARRHFYRLELDPAFRIADEAEAELLRQDVIEDLFEVWYEREDSGFLRLVEAFGSDRDDRPLMEQVLKLYTFASSHARPQDWLKALAKAYQWNEVEELAQSPWGQAVRQGLKDRVSSASELLSRAAALARRPGGPLPYLALLEDELGMLKGLERVLFSGSWSAVEEAVQRVEFGRLPAVRTKAGAQDKDDPVLMREQARKLRDEAKGIIKKLTEEFFAWPLREQIPALRHTGELVEAMAKLVLRFSEEYANLKQKRNLVDFNDLEHMALTLLEQDNEASPLALGLQERFGEVLVDEYQDINAAQERILQLISGFPGGSLFMVGDVKQSIYRFRMADPSLFLDKYKHWPHWERERKKSEEAGPGNLVLDLARNFRSRREVVEGVNFLFRQLMTAGAAEIAYDDKAALQYGASYVSNREGLVTAEGPVEVHLIDPEEFAPGTREDEAGESAESATLGESGQGTEGTGQIYAGEGIQEELEAARVEARFVGERIRRMVEYQEFQVFDKKVGNFRPVRYADIVILMRSYSAVAPLYVEELQQLQVPIFADTKTGYFGFSEVETVLSLLKVIDNPRQDIPLAAVLRSPLVGLNGAELGKLRLVQPQGDFYDALEAAVGDQKDLSEYDKDLPEELKAKLLSFWQNLHRWRTFARRHSLADLLTLIYEETGYLAYVGTLPGGPQRQANLRALYERACRFERTNYRGLFRFLRFLDKFREQGKDMGSARVLGENEDVVRLLTVHASKGLEFPVVFVVGLGSAFNRRTLSGRLLMHSSLGVGAPVIDVNQNVEYPSFIQQGIKQVLTQESVAEEMRILYVALTRAKERLLLYGSAKKLTDKSEKWDELATLSEDGFSDAYLRQARSFLDWIVPALMRSERVPFAHQARLEIMVNEQSTNFEQGLNQDAGINQDEDPKAKEEPEYWLSEVERRLNWEYPFMAEVSQIGKTSVSELKRQLLWYEDVNTGVSPWIGQPRTADLLNTVRPQFLQASTRELSPAEKGTALHLVMQHLPLSELGRSWQERPLAQREQWLAHFLRTLEERHIITAEQRAAIPGASILELLQSPLGMRLLGADKVLREAAFTLSLKLPGLQQPVLVQGVIDTLIFSEHGVEVLDYKTDRLNMGQSAERNLENDSAAALRRRYSIQLGIYALAAEDLLKLKVARCTIYALALGLELTLEPEELKDQIKELGIILGRKHAG